MCKINYISELKPELLSSYQKQGSGLRIHPYVMLHFLEFLCYKQIHIKSSKKALSTLLFLVHVNPVPFLKYELRDISCGTLGICQEIDRDLQVALYSYQQSLAQYPHNDIQSVTLWRIHCLTGRNQHQ